MTPTMLIFDAQKKQNNFNMSVLTELKRQSGNEKVRVILIKDDIIIG